MKRLRFVPVLLSVVLVATGVTTVQARTERPATFVDQAGAGTTLKVTVVLSRFAGEKKTLSLPFVLMVVAGDERPTTVQMSSAVLWGRSDTVRRTARRWAVTCRPCRRSSAPLSTDVSLDISGDTNSMLV